MRLAAPTEDSGAAGQRTAARSLAPSRSQVFWLVTAVTLAGISLRVFALGHGLPYQYVPDESTMVGSALRMGSSMSLQPSTFIYPALLMYTFAAEFGGIFVIGRLAGAFESVAAFKEYAFIDPTLFYLLPRLAVALVGVGSIPFAFLVGRRLYGSTAGIAAAFLLATSVMHVQMSHQARHWVPVGFFTLAILWVSLNLAERGRKKDYLYSGLLVGLAAATSFNGFLLMAIPVVAHMVHRRRTGTSLRSLSSYLPVAGAGALALIVFLVLNPYILIQFDRFFAFQSSGERSIGGQIRGHYDDYLGQFLARQGFTFYGQAMFAYEPAITILGIAGSVLAIRHYPSTALVVLACPAFHYFMFSTTAPSMEQRYMLPAAVVLALPAGLSVARLLERLQTWTARFGGSNLPLTLIALQMAVIVAIPSLRYDWVLAQDDTRTLATQWIERNLAPGSDVAVESYGPHLTPNLATLQQQQRTDPASLGNRDAWLLEKGLPAGTVGYQVARLNLVDTSPYEDRITPYLSNHSHRYFVVSDFRWKSDHQGHLALRRYLAREARLVATFAPSSDADYVPSDLLNNLEDPLIELWKVNRPGPRIEIYEVAR